MNSRALSIGITLAVMAGMSPASTQTLPPTSVDGLVSAAKIAAGTDWAGTFLRLCITPPPAAQRGRAAAAPGADAAAEAGGRLTLLQRTPDRPAARRASWYAEPAKVADNFYFLGTKIHNAWALVGSEGIIILEALFDYAAPDEIAGGMKKLGLDVNKVKYVIISHAHGDHDGGAKFLQDTLPSARLVYGGPDWDAVDASTNRAGGKPKRDTVGADGMKFSVGDASVQVVTTPGHTPGTISFLFEVKDNGKPLRVAYVGGTAIPFNGTADYYDGYIASVKKMAKAASDFGATVLLSNHTEFDNAFYKAHTAANRKPGADNPFDVGKAAVGRYFTVVEQCRVPPSCGRSVSCNHPNRESLTVHGCNIADEHSSVILQGGSIIMASSTRREASARKGARSPRRTAAPAGKAAGTAKRAKPSPGRCAHNGRNQVPGRRANRVPYLPEHRHCPRRQQQGRVFHWAGSPRHCAGGSISRCGRHQAPGSPVSNLSSRHRQ